MFCKICDYRCLECYGPNNSDCTKCETGYFKLETTCNIKCPKYYFEDVPTETCIKCHPSCEICDGILKSDCQKCIDIGFYELLGDCLPCHNYCK